VDSDIPEVATVISELKQMITTVTDQAVKSMMGKGNTSKFLGSVV
jgi:hypothetical protein